MTFRVKSTTRLSSNCDGIFFLKKRRRVLFVLILEYLNNKCYHRTIIRNYCISVNQYLRHNLGYKQKIQVIRRNQVYFSSSNVSTDTTVIVKD